MKRKAEYQRTRRRLLALPVPKAELDKPHDQRRITARFDLKAPFNGVVVEKNVSVGQLVVTTDILYTVADLDVLQAVGDIYERDLPLVKPGLSAWVTTEAFHQPRFPATVALVGDVVDPKTRTIKIRCDVKNLNHQLKADMFARIALEVGVHNTVLPVPRGAVIKLGIQPFVFVQRGPDEYERRQVVTGVTSERRGRNSRRSEDRRARCRERRPLARRGLGSTSVLTRPSRS